MVPWYRLSVTVSVVWSFHACAAYDVICNCQVVPLDGEVVQGGSLVNLEHITGEAVPMRRSTGEAVPAGGICMDGSLVVKVRGYDTI